MVSVVESWSKFTNRRSAIGEVLINPLSVKNLHLRWTFHAGRDISATPAVANGVVYFPSWNGTGTVTNVNVTVSGSTPTVDGDLLIVGIYGPAVVIAVNRLNGRLVWSRQLCPRPRALITMSGTIYLGTKISIEDPNPNLIITSLSQFTNDKCCTFRGSLAKLDVLTRAIRWQTYMFPDNGGKLGGYAGAAIWGSSPAIDVIRRRVYVATGNLYTAPPEVLKCQDEQNNQTRRPDHPDQCIGPGINFNSVVALGGFNSVILEELLGQSN
ncbi:hypothetical protein LWI28_009169 [Acer negundo]|uniref:Uncharacterized protein n=1 Tax=Acer negundo TaxID=4023 RepID=A0AAD5IL18_ACENE|nr:hypothetical protein LWI28_009169 [Acer negundo]